MRKETKQKLNQRIADNLKAVRKSLGLTQSEAALSITEDVGTYGAWERNRNSIPLHSIYAFCLIHNISISKIIPDYPVENDSDESSIEHLFDQIRKTTPEIYISKLKSHYIQLNNDIIKLNERLIEEKERVIEERDRTYKIIKVIREKTGMKIEIDPELFS